MYRTRVFFAHMGYVKDVDWIRAGGYLIFENDNTLTKSQHIPRNFEIGSAPANFPRIISK